MNAVPHTDQKSRGMLLVCRHTDRQMSRQTLNNYTPDHSMEGA